MEITELGNNSIPGACVTVTKELTFISLELQEEKKENRVKKVFEERIAENFPNWYKPTKEIHTKTPHN